MIEIAIVGRRRGQVIEKLVRNGQTWYNYKDTKKRTV